MDLQNLPLIFSGVSMIVAAASFWRSGKWRESDEAKALNSRVLAVETVTKSLATKEDLADLEGRINGHSMLLENLATKSEIAKLEGDIKAVKSELTGLAKANATVAANTDRILDFLLEQKK